MWIRYRNDRRQFLLDIGAVAKATGRFHVEHVFDDPIAAGIFSEASNFRCTDPQFHEDHGFQLLCRTDSPSKVDVEVRAARWHPHDPPTRDGYISAANALVLPLLRAYNRVRRSRLRLHAASEASMQPKLPPHAALALHRFTLLANHRSLHPYDWQRFYQFVKGLRYAERYRADEIRWLLLQEGLPAKMAEDLGELFEHLAAFKTLR